jgi:D-amino peptidase
MKIYISTDMEGIEGISSWNEMDIGVREKECSSFLKQELTWIIDELHTMEQEDKSFFIEEICICDSHARGENLVFGSFKDERVTHIKGYPRHSYMMEGLDESFDAVFLVGYHAMIGTLNGMMDHSYSASCIYNARLNGKTVGEVEINAYFAGLYDIPLALISGDDILQQQLEGFFKGPYVCTKQGLGRFTGKMLAPELVEKQFREKTREAIKTYKNLEVKRHEGIYELEVDLTSTVVADAVAIVPGIKRLSGRTISYQSMDYQDIFHMILTIAMLGGRFSQYK